jgi:hypothetical protein
MIGLVHHFLNAMQMRLRLPVGTNQFKVIGQAFDRAERLPQIVY